jgi:hypothetical protein
VTKINFSNVQTLAPLPEGEYQAILSEFKVVDKAKSSGKPYVALTFSITEEGYAGRKVWRNFSLQEQSLWALKQTLIRLGVDPDTLADGDVELEDILGEAIGSPCVVVIGIREYNGERNEVRQVLEASEYGF